MNRHPDSCPKVSDPLREAVTGEGDRDTCTGVSDPLREAVTDDDVAPSGDKSDSRYGLTEDHQQDAMLRAAEAGDICAECFSLIPPDAPVAIIHRWRVVRSFLKSYGKRGSFWQHIRERVDLPICMDCTASKYSFRNSYGAESGPCATCGREIRHWETSRLPSACCLVCKHLMINRRQNTRRKVHHESIACVECGQDFIPTRADAVTCSNRCRQAQHRKRRANETEPATVKSNTRFDNSGV
jgi:hypothetical protein